MPRRRLSHASQAQKGLSGKCWLAWVKLCFLPQSPLISGSRFRGSPSPAGRAKWLHSFGLCWGQSAGNVGRLATFLSFEGRLSRKMWRSLCVAAALLVWRPSPARLLIRELVREGRHQPCPSCPPALPHMPHFPQFLCF